jgi:hypothetical protein
MRIALIALAATAVASAHAADANSGNTVLPISGATLTFGPQEKLASFGVSAGSGGLQFSAKLKGPLDEETRRTTLEGDEASFVANFSLEYNDDFRAIDTVNQLSSDMLTVGCKKYKVDECNAANLCKAIGASGCSEQSLADLLSPTAADDADLRTACDVLALPTCTASAVALAARRLRDVELARRFGLPLKRHFTQSIGANLRVGYDRVSAYRGDVGPKQPDAFDKATQEYSIQWRGFWATRVVLTVRAGIEHAQGAKVKKAQRCEDLTSTSPGISGKSCKDVLVTTEGYKRDWAASDLIALTYILPAIYKTPAGAGYSPALEVSARFRRVGRDDGSIDPQFLAFVAAPGEVLKARTGIGVTFSLPFKDDVSTQVSAWSVQQFSAFAFLGADFDVR